MAKNKSNLAASKRKLAKQKKRQKLFRKKSSQAKIFQNPAYRKIERANIKMPTMIFEPEFLKINPDKDKITKLVQSGFILPEQVENMFDHNLIGETILAAKAIGARPKNDVLNVNIHSFLHLMENNMLLTCHNRVLVALFMLWRYQALAVGSKPTAANIVPMITEYEKEWADYLQQKMQTGQPAPVVPEEVASDSGAADFDDFKSSGSSAPSAALSSDINDDIQKLLQYTLKKAEKNDSIDYGELEDDVTIFLLDYLPEKDVYDPASISAKHTADFLNVWFVSKLNPTNQDIIKMHRHLTILGESLIELDLIAKSEQDKIIKSLALTPES